MAYKREPGVSKPTIVISAGRLDVRDFARLILYWRRRGVEFTSRSELLRASFEEFIRKTGIEELDSIQSAQIISEEFYIRTPRQAAIARIVSEANRATAETAQENPPKTYDQLLEELEEVDEEEIETGEPDEPI